MKKMLVWLKENQFHLYKDGTWYTTREKGYIQGKPRKFYTEDEVETLYLNSIALPDNPEREQLEDDLIDTVIEHIKKDIDAGDVSAIFCMLSFCPTEQLIQYLPEEKWEPYKELRAD